MASSSSTPPPFQVNVERIRCRELILEADEGNAIIELGFRAPDARWLPEAGRPHPLPFVALFDQDGRKLAELGLLPAGPGGLTLVDGASQSAYLEVAGNGLFLRRQGQEFEWPRWRRRPEE